MIEFINSFRNISKKYIIQITGAEMIGRFPFNFRISHRGFEKFKGFGSSDEKKL
jgi:hypothetical protein